MSYVPMRQENNIAFFLKSEENMRHTLSGLLKATQPSREVRSLCTLITRQSYCKQAVVYQLTLTFTLSSTRSSVEENSS